MMQAERYVFVVAAGSLYCLGHIVSGPNDFGDYEVCAYSGYGTSLMFVDPGQVIHTDNPERILARGRVVKKEWAPVLDKAQRHALQLSTKMHRADRAYEKGERAVDEIQQKIHETLVTTLKQFVKDAKP